MRTIRITAMLVVSCMLFAGVMAMMPLAKAASTEPTPEKMRYDLYAGKNMDVGDLYVWNCGEHIHVQYWITKNGCSLGETHLAYGDDLSEIPQTKKGNPIPGKFPLKDPWLTTPDFVEFRIALDEFDGDGEIIIAAHATVMCSTPCGCTCETAWAAEQCHPGDNPFPGRNWATYIEFDMGMDAN